MPPAPFPVTQELDGWELAWFPPASPRGGDEPLAALRRRTAERARAERAAESLAADPTVAALRSLFRAAGCDPPRYRPSSEALLRRLLKGDELPAIHPLVDLNNCVSVALAVPCCIVAERSFAPPVVLRAGKPGESYESLRGPFSLEGKPLLADVEGPRRAWMVAYLPAGVLPEGAVERTLDGLLAEFPVAAIEKGERPE